MQNDTCDRILLRQVGSGSWANRSAIQDDVVSADIQVLSHIEVDCLDIIVERLLDWYAAIALSKTGILVYNAVDIDLFEELSLKPLLNEVDILRVSMRNHKCILYISVDEEHLKIATTFTVQK